MKKFIYDREITFQFIIAEGHSQICILEETNCWKLGMAHNNKKYGSGGQENLKKNSLDCPIIDCPVQTNPRTAFVLEYLLSADHHPHPLLESHLQHRKEAWMHIPEPSSCSSEFKACRRKALPWVSKVEEKSFFSRGNACPAPSLVLQTAEVVEGSPEILRCAATCSELLRTIHPKAEAVLQISLTYADLTLPYSCISLYFPYEILYILWL